MKRGGVRHAIATRPDTDYDDNFDNDTIEGSRRSSVGGRGPGLTPLPAHQVHQTQHGPIPQPRTINVQPLRHTPSNINDGQKVRPADLNQGQLGVS